MQLMQGKLRIGHEQLEQQKQWTNEHTSSILDGRINEVMMSEEDQSGRSDHT
jgi:hypothetical protein